MSNVNKTFYNVNDEALCRALIDFFDTNTEEKGKKYRNYSTYKIMFRMHSTWMSDNGETDVYKINRFKRMCQVVELSWIEAKFPDLYYHLILNASYIAAEISAENPDPDEYIKRHINCKFCNPEDKELKD